MTREKNNPLTVLIRLRMTVLGMTQAQLLLALEKEGVNLSESAISYWLLGGGVKDEHRPAVAKVLGIPLGDLQAAASERAQARKARAAS